MYRLRELEKKDLAVINKWRNDPELIAYLGAPYRFINCDVDMRWYDTYMLNRNSTVRCTITDESDECLGLVSLTGINHLNQSAEFHIMIGDMNNHGKGMGTFAVKEMLKHAFFNLNLHRVELSVLEENRRAKYLYEKVGFHHEGTKREANFKNGKFVNIDIYSILREEYEIIYGGGGILKNKI